MHHSSIFLPGRLFRGDDRAGKIQDVQESPDDARHQETKGRGESGGGDGRRGGGLFCAEILLMIIIDNHTSDRGIMVLMHPKGPPQQGRRLRRTSFPRTLGKSLVASSRNMIQKATIIEHNRHERGRHRRRRGRHQFILSEGKKRASKQGH